MLFSYSIIFFELILNVTLKKKKKLVLILSKMNNIIGLIYLLYFFYYTFRQIHNNYVMSKLKRLSLSSVQSFSHVRLFATPCIAARQASLSITNSPSLLKLCPLSQ